MRRSTRGQEACSTKCASFPTVGKTHPRQGFVLDCHRWAGTCPRGRSGHIFLSCCWMVSISSSASSLRQRAQPTRSGSMTWSRLAFRQHPNSAGGGRERVRNAVKRVFRSIARKAGKGERGRRSVTTECDNRTRILAGGVFHVRLPVLPSN